KRMVTCNLGASVLCQSSVQKEVEAGWLSALHVEKLDLSRFIYIITRKTEKIPPGLDDFIQFAIASFSGD
ncbi:MAG: LysR substrate-binding domain-containing protein, partial [Spirochaetia bacterium]|nr:LysR substrate-binding domain-containing protein [Spirochaetia bacterium]